MTNAVRELSEELSVFDGVSLFNRYVRDLGEGLCQVTLAIDGISCAGCVAKIESRAGAVQGIQSIRINPSTHRAMVAWRIDDLSLSELLKVFVDVGFPATPYEIREQEKKIEREHRVALIRIVVAAALGMQVMMIATGLYFGEASGMEAEHRDLLRYVAMILSVPILIFCGAPFFRSAVRDLRHRSIGVDVPVSIALLVAFSGSVLATIGDHGQVYFESIAMFIFLLLCARFLELPGRRARER